MFNRCVMVLCVTAFLLLGTATAQAVNYAFFDLGAVTDTTTGGSSAYGINSSNEVTGRYYPASGGNYAAIWSLNAGTYTRTTIPWLNSSASFSNVGGWGNAINNYGTVVGQSAGTNSYNQAFTWTPTAANGTSGTLTNVGAMMPNTTASRLEAVNSAGQAVGYGNGTGAAAYYWDGTTASVIPPPAGGSNAFSFGAGINDSGLVVGTCVVGGDVAVTWHPGDANATSINPAIQAAFAPPGEGTTSFGNAVNNAGQIVGSYMVDIDPNSQAYLYNNSSTVVDLGNLGSVAGDTKPWAINSGGVVVGSSYTGVNDPNLGAIDHAFVWTPTTPNGTAGSMADLNSLLINSLAVHSNWYLWTATGINATGSISGYMFVNNGVGNQAGLRTFALIPTIPGDANLDGTVNISDLSKVLTNYDKTGMGWADGDFNGDGTVNITDLSVVLTNYDKSLGASASGVKAVPEPGMLVLLTSAVVALLVGGWRRRK